jgi:hypothetical protein
VTAGEGAEAGSVRLLVVPSVAEEGGRLRLDQLTPPDETLRAISEQLNRSRVIGTRVIVEPPAYQGITIVATLRARSRTTPRRLEEAATDALYAYFDPIAGGPDGNGWPFGRPVNLGEVYAVLQGLRGTEIVEEARIFPADLATRQRGAETQRLELEANSLVLSYEHQIRVEGA